jgi:hypothetical protein
LARRRDGTEFPVEISLAPMRSRRGPLVVATVVDITARTNLQEQLEQANAELRRHADELEERGRELSLLAQMGPVLSDRHHVGRGGRLSGARNLGCAAHPRRRFGDVSC